MSSPSELNDQSNNQRLAAALLANHEFVPYASLRVRTCSVYSVNQSVRENREDWAQKSGISPWPSCDSVFSNFEMEKLKSKNYCISIRQS